MPEAFRFPLKSNFSSSSWTDRYVSSRFGKQSSVDWPSYDYGYDGNVRLHIVQFERSSSTGLDTVLSSYHVPHALDVAFYLGQHMTLVEIIKNASSVIHKLFSSAKLELDVYDDPEVGTRQLIITIKVAHDYPIESLTRANTELADWWINQSNSNDPIEYVVDFI